MADLAAWAQMGPTIVASVAIVAAAFTTWVTLRHTRRLEASKRLWERRAEVYVDLQTWLTELISAGGTGVPLSATLKARTALFASVRVRADLFILETSIRALELEAQKLKLSGRDSSPDLKYQFDLDAENLTKRLVLELQGKEALRDETKYAVRTMINHGKKVREAREHRDEENHELPASAIAKLQTIRPVPGRKGGKQD